MIRITHHQFIRMNRFVIWELRSGSWIRLGSSFYIQQRKNAGNTFLWRGKTAQISWPNRQWRYWRLELGLRMVQRRNYIFFLLLFLLSTTCVNYYIFYYYLLNQFIQYPSYKPFYSALQVKKFKILDLFHVFEDFWSYIFGYG